MLSTLLIVLFVLAFIPVLKAGLIPVSWGVEPGRALSVLVAVLIILAFTLGFADF